VGANPGQATRDSQARPQGSGQKALFKELISRANLGDQEALTRLRQVLDSNPQLWRQAGNLTAVAEKAWIDLVAGTNAVAAESARRCLAEMKTELKGPHPTPLESMLVDLVGVTWLATRHAEIQAASTGGSLDQATFRLRRAESSQKRHLNAVKTLATLRSLLPAGLVPSKPLRVYDPEQKLA
jgi:hypothetical protein